MQHTYLIVSYLMEHMLISQLCHLFLGLHAHSWENNNGTRKGVKRKVHFLLNNRELTASFPCSQKWFLFPWNLISMPNNFYKYLNPEVEREIQFITQIPHIEFLMPLCELYLSLQEILKTSYALTHYGCHLLYFQ